MDIPWYTLDMKQIMTVKVWPNTYEKLSYWAKSEGITVDELVNTLLEFETSVDRGQAS